MDVVRETCLISIRAHCTREGGAEIGNRNPKTWGGMELRKVAMGHVC